MKKVLSVKKVFAAVAVAACGFGLAACGESKEKVFKIGFSGPLSGDAAIYGTAVKNSAQLAVDEINEKGGFDGYKFELTALDDVCEGTKAGQNYQTLFENGMQVSLGGVTSGACLEFAKNAKEDNVFCLTPSATHDGVPKVGNNVYQMCFSDSGQGTGAAAYIKENYPDATVGLLYNSSDPYSKGIYDTFVAAYGTPDVVTSFTKETNTDFNGQVTQLKDCDLVFLPIYYQDASTFITQANGKLKDNAVYFGCDGLDGIATGVQGFNVNDYKQEISYLSHFNAAATDAKTTHFVEAYKAKYGETTLNQFGAAAYDCVYAIYEAMTAAKAAGKKVTVDMSADALCKVLKEQFDNGFKFTGVTGQNVQWNADGTVAKVPTKYVVNPNRAA